MKHSVFFVFCFLLAGTLNAQIVRGDRILSLTPTHPSAAFGSPVLQPQTAATAGIYYDAAFEDTRAFIGADLGYAVLDRLLIGLAVNGTRSMSDQTGRFHAFLPRLRYYVINRPNLMVFGQAGTSLTNFDGERDYFKTLDVAAGVHFPIGFDALLTPKLSYVVTEGNNYLGLSLGLEVRTNGGEEEKAIAGFRKGRIMVGATSAGFTRIDDDYNAQLEVGAHYFLLDRLAVGGQFGYIGDYVTIRTGSNTAGTLTYKSLYAALAARYFLTEGRRLVWFAEGGLGHRRTVLKSDVLIDQDAEGEGCLTLGGGAQLYVKSNFALEVGPSAQYSFAAESWKYGLNFGFRFLL